MEKQPCHSANPFFLICVDQGHDGFLAGRVFHQSMRKGAEFANVMQLLLTMDNLLGETLPPPTPMIRRAFSPSVQNTVPLRAEDVSGRVATFAVRVVLRQHTSWQGSVTWVETGREESFRSVLELLLMLDGAVNASGQSPAAATMP